MLSLYPAAEYWAQILLARANDARDSENDEETKDVNGMIPSQVLDVKNALQTVAGRGGGGERIVVVRPASTTKTKLEKKKALEEKIERGLCTVIALSVCLCTQEEDTMRVAWMTLSSHYALSTVQQYQLLYQQLIQQDGKEMEDDDDDVDPEMAEEEGGWLARIEKYLKNTRKANDHVVLVASSSNYETFRPLLAWGVTLVLLEEALQNGRQRHRTTYEATVPAVEISFLHQQQVDDNENNNSSNNNRLQQLALAKRLGVTADVLLWLLESCHAVEPLVDIVQSQVQHVIQQQQQQQSTPPSPMAVMVPTSSPTVVLHEELHTLVTTMVLLEMAHFCVQRKWQQPPTATKTSRLDEHLRLDWQQSLHQSLRFLHVKKKDSRHVTSEFMRLLLTRRQRRQAQELYRDYQWQEERRVKRNGIVPLSLIFTQWIPIHLDQVDMVLWARSVLVAGTDGEEEEDGPPSGGGQSLSTTTLLYFGQMLKLVLSHKADQHVTRSSLEKLSQGLPLLLSGVLGNDKKDKPSKKEWERQELWINHAPHFLSQVVASKTVNSVLLPTVQQQQGGDDEQDDGAEAIQLAPDVLPSVEPLMLSEKTPQASTLTSTNMDEDSTISLYPLAQQNEQVSRIVSILTASKMSNGDDDGEDSPRCLCLVGPSGMGKTTLAKRVTQSPDARSCFASAIVWLDLGTAAPSLTRGGGFVATTITSPHILSLYYREICAQVLGRKTAAMLPTFLRPDGLPYANMNDILKRNKSMDKTSHFHPQDQMGRLHEEMSQWLLLQLGQVVSGQKQLLLVLDGLENHLEDLQWFQFWWMEQPPYIDTCRFLLTSRRATRELKWVLPRSTVLTVDRLTLSNAVELFTRQADLTTTATTASTLQPSCETIVQACDFLPLTVTVVGRLVGWIMAHSGDKDDAASILSSMANDISQAVDKSPKVSREAAILDWCWSTVALQPPMANVADSQENLSQLFKTVVVDMSVTFTYEDEPRPWLSVSDFDEVVAHAHRLVLGTNAPNDGQKDEMGKLMLDVLLSLGILEQQEKETRARPGNNTEENMGDASRESFYRIRHAAFQNYGEFSVDILEKYVNS